MKSHRHGLIQWGRVTHICVSKLTMIGSDSALSPDRCHTIIWTNDGMLLIGPPGTNFTEILIEIHTFSFKKIYLKISSGKWRPFCLGLNVLNIPQQTYGLRPFFTWRWVATTAPVSILRYLGNNLRRVFYPTRSAGKQGPVSLGCLPSQLKFNGNFFSLSSILIQWSLQNFVHDTTAVLSCHVQKLVAILWPATELQQGEFSIEFELRAPIVSETGPGGTWHILLRKWLPRNTVVAGVYGKRRNEICKISPISQMTYLYVRTLSNIFHVRLGLSTFSRMLPVCRLCQIRVACYEHICPHLYSGHII